MIAEKERERVKKRSQKVEVEQHQQQRMYVQFCLISESLAEERQQPCFACPTSLMFSPCFACF